MGMFLRRGNVLADVSVSLSGEFDASYAYAAIGGVTYTSDTTLVVPARTQVTVHVTSTIWDLLSGITNESDGTVTVNGRKVTVTDREYVYMAKLPTTIVFSVVTTDEGLTRTSTRSCTITTS